MKNTYFTTTHDNLLQLIQKTDTIKITKPILDELILPQHMTTSFN